MTRQYVERAVTLNELRFNCGQLQYLLLQAKETAPTEAEFAMLLDDMMANVDPNTVFEFVRTLVAQHRYLTETRAFMHFVNSKTMLAELRRELKSFVTAKPSVSRSNRGSRT